MTAGIPPPAELPAGLRDRVMAASREVRGAGRCVPEIAPAGPAQAFASAADAFEATLGMLRDEDWRVQVIRDLDAQGLTGHLIGVEDDVQRSLSGDQAVASANHVASTQPAADRQVGLPPASTRAEWRRAADRTAGMVRGADLDTVVALYGIRLPLADILVARAFELWTHESDIRVAAGLPPSAPAPAVLASMTAFATRMLPVGAFLTGLGTPASVHLVLTGPGGGTWDVRIGPRSPDPATVTVVTDVIGFCRLFANRVTPADLEVAVTGDAGLATAALEAATVLALD